MAQSISVMALLNKIHNDHTLVLPDIQREFVWDRDQIRLLFDSIMRGYPFGSLLIWQTRYLEVAYRDFVADYTPGQVYIPKIKEQNKSLEMVLDGQQRLQSLYIGIYGTHEGRRLYFDVTSRPASVDTEDDDVNDSSGYRFAFWKENEPNKPKRYISVSEILNWGTRFEPQQIARIIAEIPLKDDEAETAANNMRLLRAVMQQKDLVPLESIDYDAPNASAARTIDEILDIFVRVNSGGTRLSRSDLMFSIIKRHWSDARVNFDELVKDVERTNPLGIDKDFIIRGLLTVADAPPSYEVENINKHWRSIETVFDSFARALKSTIDFIKSPDVGILSASLLNPISTLFPLIYYVYHQPNQSVLDSERQNLRAFFYFLLYNDFLQRPEARIRYLRDKMKNCTRAPLPIDPLLHVIATRQRWHFIETSFGMLNTKPILTLNLVQPQVRRETMSWQEKPEVDHIFPRSRYGSQYPTLVNDIGNFAFLGKLRNIRKSNQNPWEYFADIDSQELLDDYLIDKELLREDSFEALVSDRRERILKRVRNLLGR